MQMYEECEALLAVLEIDLSVSMGLPLTRPGTALTMRACEIEKEPLAYEDARPYADLGSWKGRGGREQLVYASQEEILAVRAHEPQAA